MHALWVQWKRLESRRMANKNSIGTPCEHRSNGMVAVRTPWQALFHWKYQGFLAIWQQSGKSNNPVPWCDRGFSQCMTNQQKGQYPKQRLWSAWVSVKSCQSLHWIRIKKRIIISQPKHMVWVLKRTLSRGWFFCAPKTNVKIDRQDNIAVLR